MDNADKEETCLTNGRKAETPNPKKDGNGNNGIEKAFTITDKLFRLFTQVEEGPKAIPPAYEKPNPKKIISKYQFGGETYGTVEGKEYVLDVETGKPLITSDKDLVIYIRNHCVYHGVEYVYVKTKSNKKGFMDIFGKIHNLKMFGKKIFYIGETVQVQSQSYTSLLLEEENGSKTSVIVNQDDIELTFRIKISKDGYRQKEKERHTFEKVLEFSHPGIIGNTPYVFAKIATGDIKLVNSETLEKIYATNPQEHKVKIIGIGGEKSINGKMCRQVQTAQGYIYIDPFTFKEVRETKILR